MSSHSLQLYSVSHRTLTMFVGVVALCYQHIHNCIRHMYVIMRQNTCCVVLKTECHNSHKHSVFWRIPVMCFSFTFALYQFIDARPLLPSHTIIKWSLYFSLHKLIPCFATHPITLFVCGTVISLTILMYDAVIISVACLLISLPFFQYC